ncbi:hypothetical protein LEMLEM_LOCUS13004 [Lemmus lemmus]
MKVPPPPPADPAPRFRWSPRCGRERSRGATPSPSVLSSEWMGDSWPAEWPLLRRFLPWCGFTTKMTSSVMFVPEHSGDKGLTRNTKKPDQCWGPGWRGFPQAGWKEAMGTPGQPLVLPFQPLVLPFQPLVLPFQHEEHRPLLLQDLADVVSPLPALFRPLLG